MLKLKRYSTLYNSLMLLSVFFMLACGPGLYDENEFTSFFMPQSAYTPANSSSYYYSPAFLYLDRDEYWDMEDYNPDSFYKKDENLQEWKAYCHINVSDSLAADVIYRDKDDKTNSFYRALRQRSAAWNYLLMARKIEKASAAGGEPWNPTPADTPAMKQLFHDVTESVQNVNDSFLKGRYAYQAIKLADELSDYDSCIALYNHYFENRTDNSVIKWWSLSRKGGALLKKGDTAKAVYIFSRVFAHCPSRRKAAYMSLRLYNIRFVPAALQYCKNDGEKEEVYTLCALMPWQDALPLMKDMVKLNPNQSYLELIMAREINKNEGYYYSAQNFVWGRDTTGDYEYRQQSVSYFKNLGEFADQCANNHNIKEHAFWNTAAAYISYIEGNYKKANDYLTKASEEPTNNLILPQQIQLQKILLLTANAKQMTPELEGKVAPILANLVDSNANFYTGNAIFLACQRLAAMYKASATQKSRGWLCNRPVVSTWAMYAPAKAWLMNLFTTNQFNRSGEVFTSNNDFNAMVDTTSNATLNNLIAYYSQPNPSSEDIQLMQTAHRLDLSYLGYSNDFAYPFIGLNYLYFIKGRKAISVFHYKEAAEAWWHVADSFWSKDPFKTYLAANSFVTAIIDVHASAKADTVKYTPYQFAVRMQQLSENAKNDSSSAKDYYLLGCGAYNMSYYGNSWLLVKPNWSSGDLWLYNYYHQKDLVNSINYFSTNQAKIYFDRAMKVASNKELAALACFMAAKCEQNQFYFYVKRDSTLSQMLTNGGGYGYSNRDGSPKLNTTLQNIQNTKFHRYFNILKDKYSNSQFNKEVIRECATYRDFVEGK